MSLTILAVDDSRTIREMLGHTLRAAGYRVVMAEDGVAGLEALEQETPDVIVTDINMPRLDGLEVCRRLRAQGQTPILFLSSRDDEIDRVLGIELGADDYVVKPFSPREVTARISAILRRSQAAAAAAPASSAMISHGRLSLDTDGWTARWAGQEAALTVTEFGILKALAAAPTRVFTRDAIIDRLHGPGFAITDRTIDSHVRNLRGKFAALGGHDVIETKAGVGYRLGPCRGEAA